MMERISAKEVAEMLPAPDLQAEIQSGVAYELFISGPVLIAQTNKITKFYIEQADQTKEEITEASSKGFVYSYVHNAPKLSLPECENVVQGLRNAWSCGKSIGVAIGAQAAREAICREIKSLPLR
jgi:hypothetical protein